MFEENERKKTDMIHEDKTRVPANQYVNYGFWFFVVGF